MRAALTFPIHLAQAILLREPDAEALGYCQGA
jgi:hypothetical protein